MYIYIYTYKLCIYTCVFLLDTWLISLYIIYRYVYAYVYNILYIHIYNINICVHIYMI